MAHATVQHKQIPPIRAGLGMVAGIVLVIMTPASPVLSQPALTIYNQQFAVVRETVPLSLQTGVNDVRFSGITAHVEPDSVVLRDPAGKHALQILEQNYRNDPVTQEYLLSLFEGQIIDFQVPRGDRVETVRGKIVRSGYVPHFAAMNTYGPEYSQQQMAYSGGYNGIGQPVIEVDGKLRFSLPGLPLFPNLPDDTILKPALNWRLRSGEAVAFDAELAYVTGGMSWHADYNIVSPETGDTLDLTGWVTLDNQSGKTFENARIKLMAGTVNKIQPSSNVRFAYGGMGGFPGGGGAPTVVEKTFDEYHLYTLQQPATLRDRETKQVEFVRANGIHSSRIYLYDGLKVDQNRYNGWNIETIRQQREYGTDSNPHVWVVREFKNSTGNSLGIPLPAGRLRFYRRDADGQLEFTGENNIDHTPKDETVRVFTGDAFDLVGERRQTDYRLESNKDTLDESFEIKLRNHKREAVEIRVVEHLYRGNAWKVTASSDPYHETDSHTIEFPIQVKPDQEKTVTYSVHYTW